MRALTKALDTSSNVDSEGQRRGTAAQEAEGRPHGPTLPLASFMEAAEQRVLANVPSWAGEAVDRSDVVAGLTLVRDAIRTGDARPLREQPVGTQFLARRLVELLRAELVRGCAAAEHPPLAEAILDALSRIELVRAALDPDWRNYFSSGVSGVNGQDLIVEVAHDFRSPLTSIMFLAETLRRGQSGPVNEHQRHQLGIIYSAALGLVSVASDVIEMVRGATSLEDQEASPFSVADVLEGVRDMVRPMSEEKRLALQVVPPRNELRIGYPVPLSRALLNLTTNAIKFTDDGFVEIVARARGRDRVEFAVRDTGRGVNSEAVRNLYNPFRRARTESGFHFSGTGLGLAITRKMVEAMGSELKLDSRAGWGTRFHFELYLPVAPDA